MPRVHGQAPRAHVRRARRKIYEAAEQAASRRAQAQASEAPAVAGSGIASIVDGQEEADGGEDAQRSRPTRRRCGSGRRRRSRRGDGRRRAAAPAAQERAGGARVVDVEGQADRPHRDGDEADPQRGMRVQLVTTDVAAAHRLPPTGRARSGTGSPTACASSSRTSRTSPTRAPHRLRGPHRELRLRAADAPRRVHQRRRRRRVGLARRGRVALGAPRSFGAQFSAQFLSAQF